MSEATCVRLGCKAAERATKSREVGSVGGEGAGLGKKEDKFDQDSQPPRKPGKSDVVSSLFCGCEVGL